jgi:hypothetical protein
MLMDGGTAVFSLSHMDGLSLTFLIVLAALSSGLWLRALLRVHFGYAMLLALAACIPTIIYLMRGGSGTIDARFAGISNEERDQRTMLLVFCSCLTATLGVGLLVKVYRAVILDKVSPPERLTGFMGVRAWLRPVNAITVVALAIAADEAFGWDFFGVLLAGACLLVIYPLVGSLQNSVSQESKAPEPAPEERQRVLALVEAGKISADDASELLAALAQSQTASAESRPAMSPARRLMMLGAVVVLVGFFLPWFTISWHSIMSAMSNEVQQAMPQAPEGFGAPGAPGMPPMNFPQPQQDAVNLMTLRGGDVRTGLGWIALAGAVLAALLPFLWSNRPGDVRMMRNVTFAALGVATVGLLYLLSNSFNAVTTIQAGFVITLVGYVILWIGGVREYVAFRPRVHTALAAA